MNRYFQQKLVNPAGVPMNHSDCMTAINAVALVTGKSWEELVKSLVEQAHLRENMPMYTTCVKDMLRANGFRQIKSGVSWQKKYVAKIAGCGYCAMIPDEENQWFVIQGFMDRLQMPLKRRKIREVWVYEPGMDFQTGRHRKTSSREQHQDLLSDVSALHMENLNPASKLTGDCTLRAISAVYDCSWHEALDLLAEAGEYKEPYVNSLANVRRLLAKLEGEGFARCERPTVSSGSSKTAMTGTQFCEYLNQNYCCGEKIFALLGKNHCAAICPEPCEDGSFEYKIWDTWDSSERKVGEYWVYKKGDSKR